jgi:hypothetical protein
MSLTSYQVEPYLPINPQCHVQEICDRLGLSSRNSAKDSYRVVEQEMWDKGEALPNPKKEKDANEI